MSGVATSGFVVFPQAGQHGVILQRRGITHLLSPFGDVLEQTTHDFAAACLGQRTGKSDFRRNRERANFLADVNLEILSQFVAGISVAERQKGRNRLAGQIIRPADHRGLGHCGMRNQ